MTTRVVLLSALLTLSGVCWAAAASYDATGDAQPASWPAQVLVPAFDPALGSLAAVQLSFWGEVNGAASLE